MPKLPQLEVLLELTSPHILCISEHFLRQPELDVFALSGYSLASSFCREITGKGGVCILVSDSVKFHPVDVSSFCMENTCELAAIKIQMENSPCLIIAVYRPPYRDVRNVELFLELLYSCISSLLKRNYRILVTGDFNIDLSTDNDLACRLSNLMSSFGLRDTIRSYTREFNGSKSLIDNIFTNINATQLDTQVLITGVSDHHAQIGEINMSVPVETVPPKFKLKRQLNKNNVQLLKHLLNEETWDDVFSAHDVDSKLAAFLSNVSYYLNCVSPMKKVKLKMKPSPSKVILDQTLLQLQDKMLYFYSLTKNLESSHPLRRNYLDLKRQFRTGVRAAKAASVLNHMMEAQNKTKAIWNIVNDLRPLKKRKTFTGMSLGTTENTVTNDPVEISHEFNSYFSEIGQRLGHAGLNNWHNLSSTVQNVFPTLFLRPTDAREVASVISSLKLNHSAGSDEISSSLLKCLSEQLALPLAHIANSSFEIGQFPSALKLAIVKPLLKKGSPLDINNYRPISILSTFSKVLEKLFLSRLLSFLDSNNVLYAKQFGFRQNSSTLHAMFDFISGVVEALDGRGHSLGIFLDLSKAFDVVNHDILLFKLQRLGIRGNAFDWLSSYLADRGQMVEVPYVDDSRCLRRQLSTEADVKSGVPQGSVLGPILFLLFINDISCSISKGNLCLFADDTSLGLSHISREQLEMDTFIQVSALLQWLQVNCLTINTDKTKFIDFFIGGPGEVERGSFEIIIGNTEVQSAAYADFLGLTVDSNLKYNLHIDKVCKKISSGIFILRRLSHFTDKHILSSAYFGCIYPHLVYGLPIWGAESTRTQYIFRLQKRAIRIILGFKRSQSCRGFFRANNLLTFPCIYILETTTFLKTNPHLFNSPKSSRYDLRQTNRILIPKHRTSFFERQAYSSSIKLFNHLPSRLRAESSVKRFKIHLKSFLISKEYYSVNSFLIDRDVG